MYTMEIRDNLKGEIVEVEFEGDWDEVEEYTWEEGNYACDCNRALFFHRAKGKADPNIVCSSDRYDVRRKDIKEDWY